jgi:mannose/fructose-specific phosphotransferase system component IIA
LAAARRIVPGGYLDGIVAVDAGEGETARLGEELCAVIESEDRGRGVLLVVDLLGSSPCRCAQREGAGHPFVVLAGLNLAMLLKLASLDRTTMDALELAEACADSARRSVELRSGSPDQIVAAASKGGG